MPEMTCSLDRAGLRVIDVLLVEDDRAGVAGCRWLSCPNRSEPDELVECRADVVPGPGLGIDAGPVTGYRCCAM